MTKEYQEFSTVKYEINASFEIEGVVEKSDVVGAIFGQTEGLLGEDLDIRELQKTGRIGRINVDMSSKEGLTAGKIIIPSSLDKIETALLAATIESVDRVGPCNAKFKLESLEDVRKIKRDKIVDRATELLQKWDLQTSPETQEITDRVSSARLNEDIVSYGEEGLPAGPEIDTSDTIIICEGRADVLKLLSIGVKNAIATNGAKVPREIAELSKKKTTIAFLDGDRGGDMILNELLQVGKIDFIARAPHGKEVEELTKKDLLKSLQQKVPHVNKTAVAPAAVPAAVAPKRAERPPLQGDIHGKKPQRVKQVKKKVARRVDVVTRPAFKAKTPENVNGVPEALRETARGLPGRAIAVFFDENHQPIKEVQTSMIVDELQKEAGKVKNIVFDGIISQRLVDISSQEGVSCIVGTRIGNINKAANLKLYSIDQVS